MSDITRTNTCVRNTFGVSLFIMYTLQRPTDISMPIQVVFIDAGFCLMFETAQSRAMHLPLTVEHTLTSTLCDCQVSGAGYSIESFNFDQSQVFGILEPCFLL